jgi:hypothetical protein
LISCLPSVLFQKTFCFPTAAGVAQSVWQLGTGWTVWGSNPNGGEVFREPLDSYLSAGTGSFQGVKQPGRGADIPLSSSAIVANGLELYPSPVCLHLHVMGWLTFGFPIKQTVEIFRIQ